MAVRAISPIVVLQEAEVSRRKFIREYPRVRTRLAAEVWQDRRHWSGVITVLGAGGILLETDIPLEIGSTLGIRLTPPGEAAAMVCAAVVRNHVSEPPSVGLEFVLTRDHRERLARALEAEIRRRTVVHQPTHL